MVNLMEVGAACLAKPIEPKSQQPASQRDRGSLSNGRCIDVRGNSVCAASDPRRCLSRKPCEARQRGVSL